MDYAGVIIERKDGKLLFQLRDSNPDIKNQNLWSLFGGGIKKSEKPLYAVTRELKEELGIKVNKKQLTLLATFPGFKKRRYIFKLKRNLDIGKLKLGEGDSLGYFSILEILKKENVVSSLRLLLLLYPILNLVTSSTPLRVAQVRRFLAEILTKRNSSTPS